MYSIVYTTFKNRDEAEDFIAISLEKRLIACANIFPINSMYRWDDKIVSDEEIAVFLKTRKSLVLSLIKTIEEHHPYDVPCALELNIESGSPAYLNWIEEETSQG